MATEPAPQRAWRSACPNCGAPVELRSAASAFAVCGFCSSTLAREGEALRRIGAVGELFDDHSPLQIGTTGRYQGVAFALVGRLQYRTTDGTWNEWHALFDNGRSGWLSEDNGRHVFSFAADAPGPLPRPDVLRPGAMEFVGSEPWSVAAVTQATLIAAQGELPFAPKLDGPFTLADLRDAAGRVATIDYADGAQPRWFIGTAVELPELAPAGLRDESAREVKSRTLACPSCGASLALTLESTKAIACHQCKAVVDVSKGVGGDLAHYAQETGAGHEPAIPLGSTGLLRLGGIAADWQVVGYQERRDVPTDSEEDSTSWREYLLYNRLQGFAFLVDAEDGWSWVRPISSAPQRISARQVKLDGVMYARQYEYDAVTTFVLGEFYWPVARDQKSRNTDYTGTGSDARLQLNCEASGNEVVWSRGEAIDAAELVRAFRLQAGQQGAAGGPGDGSRPASAGLRVPPDLGSFRPAGGSSAMKVIVTVVVVLILISLLSRCDDDCDALRQTYGASSAEYQNCQRSGGGSWRNPGGSWGGYSGGGGHK